jgi:hypothetical protein
MRMWKVNPRYLCRQHLLGEHVENHMFVSSLLKGLKAPYGCAKAGFVELHNLRKRHEELVEEMKRRNYRHNSPIPESFCFTKRVGKVDVKFSEFALLQRCLKCRERMIPYGFKYSRKRIT